MTSYGYDTIIALRPGELATLELSGRRLGAHRTGRARGARARLLVPREPARAPRADRDRGRARMIELIAGKVALALITLAFVLTFNFFLFRAVGDPRNDLLRVPHMSEVQREHLIHARGLDRSLLDQYGIYVRNTLSGQLETSYHSGRPVTDVIGGALPNTLILAIPATILAALLGTWIGIVTARRRGSAPTAG